MKVGQGKVNVRIVDPAAIRNKLFAMQRVGHRATPNCLPVLRCHPAHFYRLAMTSISTKELPGIPPEAMVVRTGGSGPNLP